MGGSAEQKRIERQKPPLGRLREYWPRPRFVAGYGNRPADPVPRSLAPMALSFSCRRLSYGCASTKPTFITRRPKYPFVRTRMKPARRESALRSLSRRGLGNPHAVFDRAANGVGFSVAGVADNPKDATRAIRVVQPDAIIIDLGLRDGGSGLDVLRDLQRDSNLPALKIVLTNYFYGHLSQACLGAGAHYFFDKARDINLMDDAIGYADRRNRKARRA